RLVGAGAKLVGAGTDSAVVASGLGTSNILFGVHIRGFSLHGTFTGDAIDMSVASAPDIRDIVNYANVGGAVLKMASVLTATVDSIIHLGSFGGPQIGSHAYLI